MAAAMVTPGERQFAFGCEFLDPISSTLRRFSVAVWEKDGTVEVYDPKARRTFLKRCEPLESVAVDDFFIGNTVTVMSRPYLVKEYLNAVTKERFSKERATSICLIKPDGLPHVGRVMDELYDAGFAIGAVRMVRLSEEEAGIFYETRKGKPGHAESVRLLSSDAVVALVVGAENAVSKLQGLAGPADPRDAKEALPTSIRARFGTDRLRNTIHVSASQAEADRETAFLFSGERTEPTVFRHCSAVIIRPHAVRERSAGKIIQALLDAGLEVSGMRTTALEGRDIDDYLEAYKGVVPEHGRWTTELSSGSSLILEVRGDDVVPRVRALCGPYCPEIARHLHPTSLRARFGRDRAFNAVLCTDIPDDGPLECKFLFRVVD